ncbi:unnamed protein product [marine sediment metagenome]|uniref:Uncharacterized protein n=1 Tax=marine sediment metagenome TaxID=412755 RepID=X1T8G3_9ZZZZ
MANEEWKRLQEALRKAPTPAARKEAAEAMRRYLATHPSGSKPTLVSLGYKKTYPHAIPLEQIPDELERNPEFFELMGRIAKEK